jgi:hypothetical protein
LPPTASKPEGCFRISVGGQRPHPALAADTSRMSIFHGSNYITSSPNADDSSVTHAGEFMEILLIVLVVFFVFGGGGYYGYRRWR